MVAFGRDADVQVLAQLDVAVGAENEGAAVSPVRQPVRGEPVDPEVARSAVIAGQRHVAKVVELGVIGVVVVGNLAADNFCVLRSGVVENLLDLVAADIAEDAAVLGAAVEPVRPLVRGPQAVRPHADDLQDPADSALFYQLASQDGALDVQPLAEIDKVPPPRPRAGGLDGVELREGGEGGLVGEVVLAVLHHPDAEGGAVAGDGSRCHELYFGVGEDLLLRFGGTGLGVFLPVVGDLRGVGVIDPLEGCAGLQQAVCHAVDVAVFEPDRCEGKFAGADYRAGLSGGGVVHAVRFLHKDSSF